VKTAPNAIPTEYNGIRFRSRLEARWAVFYDSLQIDYIYEEEGFALKNVWYLPDFYLPAQDCYIEVKGPDPTHEEIRKADMLSQSLEKDVFLFYRDLPAVTLGEEESPYGLGALAFTERTRTEGMESKNIPFDDLLAYERGDLEYVPYDYGYYWTQCPNPNCSKLGFGITKHGLADLLPCKCFSTLFAKLHNLVGDALSVDEERLLWCWLAFQYNSPVLRQAYNNARAARFDATDKEHLKPLSDYPLSEDQLEFVRLQYNELRADAESAESAHAEFVRFMLKRPDLYEVREVSSILKLYNIRLPRID